MAVKTKEKKCKVNEEVFNKYFPLVKAISRKYSTWNEPMADLEQIGAIGLMKAMRRFSKKQGNEFSSYACPTIDGEIRHYLRDKTGHVKISRKWIELNTRINRFMDEKRASTGKKASSKEVAKALGIKTGKVEKTKDAVSVHFTSSLDAPLFALQNAEANIVTLGEAMGDNDHANTVIQKSVVGDALAVLPERNRQVMTKIFFEDKLQSDVAKEEKITQAQVSRIIKQSLDQLKEILA